MNRLRFPFRVAHVQVSFRQSRPSSPSHRPKIRPGRPSEERADLFLSCIWFPRQHFLPTYLMICYLHYLDRMLGWHGFGFLAVCRGQEGGGSHMPSLGRLPRTKGMEAPKSARLYAYCCCPSYVYSIL